jgi:hypothetical protein
MRLFKNVVATSLCSLGGEEFIGQASSINQATTKCPNLNKKYRRKVITV